MHDSHIGCVSEPLTREEGFRCMCQQQQQQQLSQTASVAYEKIKQSESFPLNGPPTQSLSAGFFWHRCRWETWRRGSEAHWSGTQQGPEFRMSSNCGCEEEEVLTFHWSIFTHLSLGSYALHSHTDTDFTSHLPSLLAHGHYWRFFLL